MTASTDATARIWDVDSDGPLETLRGHTASLRSAAFSPDGERVVIASRDKTARIWDVESGAPVEALRGHTAPVKSAAFSPDGERVVTASLDKTARIWDVESGARSRHCGDTERSSSTPRSVPMGSAW